MKHLKMDPTKSVAAVQGFGNVSQYAAIGFTDILGGKVACVSCWDREAQAPFTASHPDGVDARFLQTITDTYGGIDKDKAHNAGYIIEDGEAWITKDADVLIPGALEGQINAETVMRVSDRVRIVAEGANGPTTPEADEVFKRNDVFVIPDFLCNAGGVTVSYFESVQNDMNYYWVRDEVLSSLDKTITKAFNSVVEMAEGEKVFMRDAAYMVAIAKVVKAMGCGAGCKTKATDQNNDGSAGGQPISADLFHIMGSEQISLAAPARLTLLIKTVREPRIVLE